MAELIGEIEWYRGDSYPLEITIKNAKTKAVIDITGYSFILTVDSLKDPPDDSTKIFDVAGVLPAPTTGVVTFTPPSVDTNFAAGNYYYDIQMTTLGGDIRTIAKFKWKQTQDISK